jgi:hypothetical protein
MFVRLLRLKNCRFRGFSTHYGIEKVIERLKPTLCGRDRVNINGYTEAVVISAKDPIKLIIEECKSVNAQTIKSL